MIRPRREKFAVSQARDRGSLGFKSRMVEREGSVMSIAKRGIITVPPTMSIKGAAGIMAKHGFRRLPVADPGTKRLLGIIGSSDIIDFLGGGEKARLLQDKHKGNFLAAVNDSVREIMVTDVISLDREDDLKDCLSMMLRSGVGGVVIIDDDRRVVGMITERDFVYMLAGKSTGKNAEEYMTKRVVMASPEMTLGEATRAMARYSFRRLPVVEDKKLVGMLTTRDIIQFIGNNKIFTRMRSGKLEGVLDTPVGEIMKEEVSTVSGETDLGDVARIIEESGRGTVCVVGPGGLEGILTERDIMRTLVD
ncbi:MAG: CBS domain-containing protein [Candidatus Hydrothermarchaeaceae archaeon]